MPQVDLSTTNIMEKKDEELNEIYSMIESLGIVFRYLEWTKERKPTNSIIKVNSYHTEKVARNSSSSEFVEKLRSNLTYLKEHTSCMISQLRRIKSIKNLVNGSNEKSRLLLELIGLKMQNSTRHNKKSRSTT